MELELQLKAMLFALMMSSSRSASPTTEVKRSTKPSAKCDFSVHKDGPGGAKVTGTALDVELYYSIRCSEQDGYCLLVANCTISTDEAGFKPYPIIDENGCSLEPSLYGDVTYESAFVAGIRNPFPVRFRSSSGDVLLYCVTTLMPTTLDGVCKRFSCPTSSSSFFTSAQSLLENV